LAVPGAHFVSQARTPLTLENVYTGISAGLTLETSSAFAPTFREFAAAQITVKSIELTFAQDEILPQQ